MLVACTRAASSPASVAFVQFFLLHIPTALPGGVETGCHLIFSFLGCPLHTRLWGLCGPELMLAAGCCCSLLPCAGAQWPARNHWRARAHRANRHSRGARGWLSQGSRCHCTSLSSLGSLGSLCCMVQRLALAMRSQTAPPRFIAVAAALRLACPDLSRDVVWGGSLRL